MPKKSLILLLLFIIPIASAGIELTELSQNIYNLGEKIYFNAYIKQDKDMSGLFKIKINCNEYELQYFITPLNLKANEEKKIEIPSLEADSSLLGICRIIAVLESNEGVVESAESEEFEVAKNLVVSLETNKEEYDPGETIELKIDMMTRYGFDIEPYIDVLIDSDKIDSFNETKIGYETEIPEKIKSGTHTINIEVNDEEGNSGEASKEITIAQIPTKIDYQLNKEKFLPEETLEIRSLLYDQADDIIHGTLKLVITDPDNNLVYSDDIDSDRIHKYKFSKYAKPGIYSVLTSHEGISKEIFVEVNEYLNLDIKLEGEIVYIKNTGNIHYNDEKSIVVVAEKKNYIITRDIALAPEEETQIELSKELPEGNYEVIVPSYDPKAKSFDNVSLENVAVSDDRSIPKKTTDGIFAITGAVTGAVSTVGGLLKPSVAAIIMIMIIFGLSVYFYLKGKEEE